ncbi:hypothetical protein ACQKMN_02840 [Ureibacillus composti]
MEKGEKQEVENENKLLTNREEVSEEQTFELEDPNMRMNDWKENTFHIIPFLSHFL